MKTCKKCNTEKEDSQFRVYKTYTAGLCIQCENEYKKDWRRFRQKDNKFYERERLLQEGKNRCVRCEEIKPLDEFNKSNHVKTGYHNTCKSCQSVRNRQALVKKLYDVTLDDLHLHLENHEWKCNICGSDIRHKKQCVDHDHDTGQFRGILCDACNRGMGLLKDDPNTLLYALSYLKDHGKVITDHLKLRELLED